MLTCGHASHNNYDGFLYLWSLKLKQVLPSVSCLTMLFYHGEKRIAIHTLAVLVSLGESEIRLDKS